MDQINLYIYIYIDVTGRSHDTGSLFLKHFRSHLTCSLSKDRARSALKRLKNRFGDTRTGITARGVMSHVGLTIVGGIVLGIDKKIGILPAQYNLYT